MDEAESNNKYLDVLIDLRGLINDMIHQLLSASMALEDIMVESDSNVNLLHTDVQLVSAINTLYKIRSILLFYTNK